MATLATIDIVGNFTRFSGGVGVSNGDTVIQTNDASRYDSFTLISVAGAMAVFVSLDGTHYTTAALSLIDLGATTVAPVVVTAAGRLYAFYGNFALVQVQQSGGTAVTGATLVMTKKGGQY
jgi:hypothetical protein